MNGAAHVLECRPSCPSCTERETACPAALGDTASAVPAPVHSALAQDVINSYQVGWQLAAVQNLALQEQKKAEENYAGALQDLIDSVNDISTPTVIAMQGKNTVGETSGHAVLLLSVLEENEEYYVVRCCDPNEATKFTNMLVYKTPGYQQLGLRILYYGSSQPGEAETVYTDLYYWSTSIEDIDAYHYFTENNYQGSYAAKLLTVGKTQGVWVRNETGKRYIVDGKSLLEGIVFGPILEPNQLNTSASSEDQLARYYLDDSTATGYTVGFEQMEAGGSVQLLADNLGACLSTTGEGSMTVEEGTKTVAVSLDTQADTTVAITNQEASEDWDWFQAEISVPDAGNSPPDPHRGRRGGARGQLGAGRGHGIWLGGQPDRCGRSPEWSTDDQQRRDCDGKRLCGYLPRRLLLQCRPLGGEQWHHQRDGDKHIQSQCTLHPGADGRLPVAGHRKPGAGREHLPFHRSGPECLLL